MFTLNEKKENLGLSYISHSGASSELPTGYSVSQDDALFFYSQIEKALSQSNLLRNKFEFAWGPAALDRKNNGKVDHIVYIVKSIKEPGDYRLVIRGSVTLQNWQDNLDVFRTEKWEATENWSKLDEFGQGNMTVSKGMFDATQTIIEGKSNNAPGKGMTLVDFLVNEINNGENKVSLTVTGMSLGGCLASTIYVYLKNFFGNSKYKDSIYIRCCSFGAPSAGNVNFVEYLQNISINSEKESDFTRVCNDNDIVTLAWEDKGLRSIDEIYEGVSNWRDDDIVSKMMIALRFAIPVLKVKKYTQPNPAEHFSYSLNQSLKKWSDQALFQHVTSYPDNYNLTLITVGPDSNETADIVIVSPEKEPRMLFI